MWSLRNPTIRMSWIPLLRKLPITKADEEIASGMRVRRSIAQYFGVVSGRYAGTNPNIQEVQRYPSQRGFTVSSREVEEILLGQASRVVRGLWKGVSLDTLIRVECVTQITTGSVHRETIRLTVLNAGTRVAKHSTVAGNYRELFRPVMPKREFSIDMTLDLHTWIPGAVLDLDYMTLFGDVNREDLVPPDFPSIMSMDAKSVGVVDEFGNLKKYRWSGSRWTALPN